LGRRRLRRRWRLLERSLGIGDRCDRMHHVLITSDGKRNLLTWNIKGSISHALSRKPYPIELKAISERKRKPIRGYGVNPGRRPCVKVRLRGSKYLFHQDDKLRTVYLVASTVLRARATASRKSSTAVCRESVSACRARSSVAAHSIASQVAKMSGSCRIGELRSSPASSWSRCTLSSSCTSGTD
jgi:hypothetical protein